MSNPTPAAEQKKVVTTPKLIANRLKGAEFARIVHRATPEASVKFDDMLAPSYWSHVAAKVSLHDIIEVIPEGGAFYAELLVVGCSKQHVKVVVLTVKKLAPESEGNKVDEMIPPKFTIEFKGPQRRFSVIRAVDKTYVKDGFDNREDAAAWLSKNEADLLA